MRNFLLLDGPDHTRLRARSSPALHAERRAALAGTASSSEPDRLLDGKRELDVIAELAYPLPLGMIADALGVPPDDEARIAAWGTALLETLDNPMPLTVGGALRMAKAVALRRSHPVALLRAIHGIAGYARRRLLSGPVPADADILRALQAGLSTGELTMDEAIGTWILIVIAGHETTANIIGTTLHLLLAHPEQRALVDDDPGLVPSAVREALRLESPVPLGIREAAAATTVAGQPVAAGTTVNVLFGAANRDPEVFDEPDRFDIRRAETAQLAFGHGSHFCVGAQLAQLEAEVAVAQVLRRHPRLAPGARPVWRPTFADTRHRRAPDRAHSLTRACYSSMDGLRIWRRQRNARSASVRRATSAASVHSSSMVVRWRSTMSLACPGVSRYSLAAAISGARRLARAPSRP